MEHATPTQRRLSKGEVIFRQGATGDSMYFVLDGSIRLILGDPGHERELSVMKKGDFFGELSLLSGEPRSATAEVVDDATVLEIGPETFQMMVHDDLAIVRRIMEVQGRRVARTNLPIQELGARLRRVRVAAACLRALRGGATRISLAELEKAAGLPAKVVRDALEALADKSGGRIDGEQWLAAADSETRLLDAISELSAGS